MLCVLSLLYEEHLSHGSPAKCALKFSPFKLFFLYIEVSILMKAPFLKSPLVPRGSGHHFSSGCHLSFWERFLGLLTSLLCTKFPTELLCSDSCLLPSKLIQNSLAYLKRRCSFCTFSNKLLGITFCSVLI